MPSVTRRSVLASIGTGVIAGFAGCSLGRERRPPAGSLQFANEHTLPHLISMQVTGVGTDPGQEPSEVVGDPIVPPSQRRLIASTVVQPGETQTYEKIFTEDVWYGVKFTLDEELPENNAGNVTFNPAPTGDDHGSILRGKVYQSGKFSWIVSSTENLGLFKE